MILLVICWSILNLISCNSLMSVICLSRMMHREGSFVWSSTCMLWYQGDWLCLQVIVRRHCSLSRGFLYLRIYWNICLWNIVYVDICIQISIFFCYDMRSRIGLHYEYFIDHSMILIVFVCCEFFYCPILLLVRWQGWWYVSMIIAVRFLCVIYTCWSTISMVVVMVFICEWNFIVNK